MCCPCPMTLSFLQASVSGLFFFFQAEDGIRDRNVTGVQTCALPIYWTLVMDGVQYLTLKPSNLSSASHSLVSSPRMCRAISVRTALRKASTASGGPSTRSEGVV